MDVYLKKHGESLALHRIKVSWTLTNDTVHGTFSVTKKKSGQWHSDEVFTTDASKNWGLWNKDVVEIFFQLRSSPADLKAPYLELQVSPLNQPFALIILEPRKTFLPPKALEFFHEVVLEDKLWTTTFRFKIPSELKGHLPYGGFFSCLDHAPREYYALDPNPEENPDFHRPELFLPLGNHE